MDNIVIRPAKDAELTAAAQLRWQWGTEKRREPAVTPEEFQGGFVDWARAHSSLHHCLLMLRDDKVIGMAWLAVLPRVPSPRSPNRASGDVQCVYVVPSERNNGLGALLTRIRE